jgi:hypothetical protein
MPTETLRTPEAPVWFSTLWNNPTKTTLSENIFATRLGEIQSLKSSLPEGTYTAMLKPFQDSFNTELKAGIAITSLADLTRIERFGLMPVGTDFKTLKVNLESWKKSYDQDGDQIGYFRCILKVDSSSNLSFTKNNSWIWNHDGGGWRQFGIGNLWTTVHYEVDFTQFPRKDSFENSLLRGKIASLEANKDVRPEIQPTAWEAGAQKKAIIAASRENQVSTILRTKAGQRMLLGLKEVGELKGLIEWCSLGNSCMNNWVVDVVALQERVKEFNPNPKKYAGKKWADGLCWEDTLAAVRGYTTSV